MKEDREDRTVEVICRKFEEIDEQRVTGSSRNAREGRCVELEIPYLSSSVVNIKRRASLKNGARITISLGGVPEFIIDEISAAICYSRVHKIYRGERWVSKGF